jgi:NADH:ubiquinone oxidoreductase subunit 2 (subunit N)
LEIGNYLAVAVIIVGTLLTLAFFIKILEKMLFEERQAPKLPGLEAPFPMRLGMGMVVVSILVLGIFSDPTIQLIQNVALPSGF